MLKRSLRLLPHLYPQPALYQGHKMQQHLQSRGLSADSFDSLLRAQLAKPDVHLLDVRGPAEFALGSIESSTNIPHDELDRRLDLLPGLATPIVVYCASGRRAQAATQFLNTVGYQHVFNAISWNVVADCQASLSKEGKE